MVAALSAGCFFIFARSFEMRLFQFFFIFLFGSSIMAQSLIDTYPYFEDFNDDEGGWSSSNTAVIQYGTPAGNILNGGYNGSNAWATGLSSNYFPNQYGWIESPVFDFSTLVNQVPWIRLKLNYITESCCDNLRVEYSLDAGSSFQLLPNSDFGQNWYNGNGQNFWSGDSEGWIIASIRDSVLLNEEDVKLRITFFSDFNNENEGFVIDDVEVNAGFDDIEATSILSLESSCSFSSQETIKAQFTNLGQGTLNNVSVFYSINNGPSVSGGTLSFNSGESKIHDFSTPADLSQNGSYLIKVWASNAVDMTDVNDTAYLTVENFSELSSFPYTEDFESGDGGWESSGTNSSWALGKPMKRVISANDRSGDQSWVTGGLEFGEYNNDDTSMVQSPCFDLTGISDPVMQLDVWWNSEADYDGAVLQINRNDGMGWSTVGESGQGTNWYNNQDVEALYDYDSAGWSGRNSSGDGSRDWVQAQGKVERASADTSVRFRVLFASDISVRDDGFAFDNIFIYNRVAQDVAVDRLLLEGGSFVCMGDTSRISVVIRNNGSSALSGFAIQYDYGSQSGSVNYPGSLAVGAVDTLALPDLISSSSDTVSVLAFSNLGADPYQFNDSVRGFIETFPLTADYGSTPSTSTCDSSSALLTVIVDSTQEVNWYSDAGFQNRIGQGDQWQTPVVESDQTFYFQIHEAGLDTLGPGNHNFGTGSFSSVRGTIFIEAERPIILQNAWIDAQGFGTLKNFLKDREGNILDTTRAVFGPGWNRIFIGFRMDPGSYVIEIDEISTSPLYRIDSGAKYSGYEIPGVVRLTGNEISPEFYYYLYNMEVSLLESCPGSGSYNVTVGNVAPTAAFTYEQRKNRVEFINLSTSASEFVWNFGDGAGTNFRNPYHEFDSGTHIVKLTAESKCGSDEVQDTIEVSEITAIEKAQGSRPLVNIYPNPGRENFQIQVEGIVGDDTELRIFDLAGEEKRSLKIANGQSLVEVGELLPGTYILWIRIGDQIEVRRWVKL